MKLRLMLATALVAAGAVGSAIAQNRSDDAQEVKAMAAATVSAREAVQAAESQSGGKVVELTLLPSGSYQVSVLKSNGTAKTFSVDSKTGAIAAIADNQAGSQQDIAEKGEGPNDADSANEDAN